MYASKMELLYNSSIFLGVLPQLQYNVPGEIRPYGYLFHPHKGILKGYYPFSGGQGGKAPLNKAPLKQSMAQ